MIGYSERKTELKLIKFHFETLPSVHSCYRSFVRGYIRRRFPTHIGLFLTGKAGARIKSEIVQTDVSDLHDSCSLCVLVNVEEQQRGTALTRRTTGSEGDLSCPALYPKQVFKFFWYFPKSRLL